jgi:hypothetical protein
VIDSVFLIQTYGGHCHFQALAEWEQKAQGTAFLLIQNTSVPVDVIARFIKIFPYRFGC